MHDIAERCVTSSHFKLRNGAWTFSLFCIPLLLLLISHHPQLTTTKAMAVAHIVLLKFKPTISEEQAQDILKKVADLKNKLPVESVHLGVNFSARSKGFTHGFTMVFKDRAALETYDKSPEHIDAVLNFIRPNIDDILAFDYDIEDYSSPRL